MTDRAVFVDREKIMVPCGTTAEAWCARYDLEPFDAPCSSCGAVVRTTIPFNIPQFGYMSIIDKNRHVW